MRKVYTPNIGETTKIITSKIKANLGSKPKKRKYKRIEKFKSGKFKNSDYKYLIRGIEFLQIIGDAGVESVLRNLNSDEDLKPETVKLMTLLRIGKGPLYDFLNMYKDNMYSKYDTEREIASIVRDYENQLHRIQDNKFSTYLGLGMSLVSILGAIYSESKNSKSTAKALGISGLVSVGTLLGRRFFTKDYKEKVGDTRRDIGRLEGDLVENEPVSGVEERDKLKNIEDNIYKASSEEMKIEDKVKLMKAIDVISMSVLTGVIGAGKLKKAEKLDAKTLSQILLEINQNNYLIRNIMDSINSMYKFQHENERLREYEKEMENIVSQIEEKQDPLVEIQKPFEKLEIKDFKGKFYQQKSNETGKIRYRTEIEVPEFSIKKEKWPCYQVNLELEKVHLYDY